MASHPLPPHPPRPLLPLLLLPPMLLILAWRSTVKQAVQVVMWRSVTRGQMSVVSGVTIWRYMTPASLGRAQVVALRGEMKTHTGRCMAVVLLEVVLPGAGHQGMPRQDRRLGRGHRGVRWRHAAGPIVPLQDHRGPSPQPLQVLHMSGTPHFSTHTTTTNRPQRSSELRGARRHRAAPTRYPRSTGWTRRTAKGNKVPSLVSELGDTILTHFRPRPR